MVDLNRIDLATKEDRAWHIDHWAKLFKATTWEEIRMIAEKEKQLAAKDDKIVGLEAEIERLKKQVL